MSNFFASPEDIKLLSALINPPGNDSSDDEEHVTKKATNTYLSPADLAKKKPVPTKVTPPQKDEKNEIKKSPYEKIEENKKKTELDYEDETLQKVDELIDESTWKSTPVWDLSYSQAVTASDVFLQMGNKTAATASCENMVVKISIPGESHRSIDLKITETELKLISAKYFLKIPLPHPVNPQLGNAKFDNDTDHLIVTLVMDREFDFVNY